MSILAIAIIVVGKIVHQEKEVIALIRVDPDLIVSQDKNIETIASIETIDHIHMTEDKAQTSEKTNTHLINNKTIDTDLEATLMQDKKITTEIDPLKKENTDNKKDQTAATTHTHTHTHTH